MIKIETRKIEQMFDYLYNSTNPLTHANGAFVFCRDDPLIAQRVAELFTQDLIEYVMFTGGIGKDSGYLTNLNLPEANWQAGLLNLVYGIPGNVIHTEIESTNGGECCRFGIDTLINNQLDSNNLIIVVHPTSLRRVQATLEVESHTKLFKTSYQGTGTNYIFNPKNPQDQKEAVAELLRLADWPAKGWCTPQPDLPLELVVYAREIQ